MKYTLDLLPLRAFQGRGTPVGGRSLRLHGGDGGWYNPNTGVDSGDYGYSYEPAPWSPPPEPAPAPWSPPPEAAPEPAPAPWSPPPEPAPAPWSPPPAPAPAPAPANQWEQTVNDIYQQTFGRQADASGMATFTALLNQGLTGEQMREALRTSEEGQSYGLSPAPAPTPAPTGIAALPAAAKAPQWEWQPGSTDEFTGAVSQPYWMDVNSGERRELATPANIQTVRDEVGNVSYVNADTGAAVDTKQLDKNITGYDKEVTNLYQNLLGRTPNAEEVAFYNNQLQTGAADFNDVIKGFTTSPEFLQAKMPFLDPNADVNTKFEQGVRGFDAKGLTRGGALEGLPTHYFDPQTGKLAAWFGTNSGETATDFYTWHTADELKVPGSEMRLAEESKRDVGAEWRDLGRGALKVGATVLGGYLAGPAAGLVEAGVTTGSVLADAALKSAAMNALTTVASGGSATDVLKAGVIGAVSGAAGSAIGGINGGEGLGSFGNALAKAGVQTGITALTGGNVPNALIASAISTALPMALDTVIPKGMFDSLPDVIKNSIVNTASRALTAAATGGDVSDAALKSILSIAGNTAKAYSANANNLESATTGELGFASGDKGAGGNLSQQLFQDAQSRNDFGTTTTPTPTQNNAPSTLDTGYRAEPIPVAAPVDTTSKLLDALPPSQENYTADEVNDFFASYTPTVGTPSALTASAVTSDANPVDEYGTPFNISANENNAPFNIPADENGVPLPPSAMDKIRNIKEAQDYLYQPDSELKSSAAELWKQYYPDQPFTTIKDGVEINRDGTPVKQYGSAVPIVDAQGNLVRHEGEMRPAEPSMTKQLIDLVASTSIGRSQLGNLNTAANMIPGFVDWASRLVGRSGQIADDMAQDNPDTETTKDDKAKLYSYIEKATAPFTNVIQKYSGISPNDPAFNSGEFTTAMTLYGDAMRGLATTISGATGFDVQDVEDVLELAVPAAVSGAAKGASGVQSSARNAIATASEAYFNARNELGGREVYNPNSGKFESIANPAEVAGRAAAGVMNTVFGPNPIKLNDPVGTSLLPSSVESKTTSTTSPTGGALTSLETSKVPDTTTPALEYRPAETAPKDVATFFDDIFAKTDEVAPADKTPTAGLPDTREVLTPEKVESLRQLLIEPDYEVKPSYPGGTSFDQPATPSPVTQRATDTSTTLPTKVAEPVKPIDLGSSALMKQLEEQMAAYEKSGVTRDEATNKNVTDLANTTTTFVEGLQKTLTDTIAANEKSGLSRDQATNKAITDLAKATNLSDAAIKDLIASTAQTGQKDTQAQVAGLQKTLTDTIAANEKSGLSRDQATTKAIADLAKSTGTSDAELKALIGTTAAAGQTFTQAQVTGLQKSLTDTIAANEKSGLTRDQATNKAIQDLAASTGKSDAEIKSLVSGVQTGLEGSVSQVKNNLEALISANESAGLSRDQATQQAIQSLSASTGASVADLNKALQSTSQELTGAVEGVKSSLESTIAANEQSGMERDAATAKAIADLSQSTGMSDADLRGLIGTTAQASQQYTQQQITGLQNTLSQQIAANEQSGMARDVATDKAITDLAKSTGASVADLKNAISGVSTNVTSAVSGLKSNLEGLIAANESAGLSRDQATQNAIDSLAASTGTSVADLKKLITSTQADLTGAVGGLKSDIAASSQAGQQYTQQQVANLQNNLTQQIAANEQSGMDRDAATNKAVNDVASSLQTTNQNLLDAIGATGIKLDEKIRGVESAFTSNLTGLSGDLSGQIGGVKTDLSNAQTALADTIAANEASGLSRSQATDQAIADLAKQTNMSDADLRGLIGSTAQSSQQYTQTQVAELQNTLSQQIADNKASGLSQSQATDKAVADLSKQTNLSNAELRKLVEDASQSSQQYTQQQVADLQKNLSQQIAANEASGLSRNQATDKAVTDLATQTKLTDAEVRRLITATAESGQKSTKEQIAAIEAALGQQLTGIESGLAGLSTNFQTYQTQQAKAEAAQQKAAAAKAQQAKVSQMAAQLSQTQQVSAKTPPGAEIDYLYDIGGESIFAPKKSDKKQKKESYYDLYNGGYVDDAGSIEDLYNMLGSK